MASKNRSGVRSKARAIHLAGPCLGRNRATGPREQGSDTQKACFPQPFHSSWLSRELHWTFPSTHSWRPLPSPPHPSSLHSGPPQYWPPLLDQGGWV